MVDSEATGSRQEDKHHRIYRSQTTKKDELSANSPVADIFQLSAVSATEVASVVAKTTDKNLQALQSVIGAISRIIRPTD